MTTNQNLNYLGLSTTENGTHLSLQFFIKISHLPLQNSLYLSHYLAIFLDHVQHKSKLFEIKPHKIWKKKPSTGSNRSLFHISDGKRVSQQRAAPSPDEVKNSRRQLQWLEAMGTSPESLSKRELVLMATEVELITSISRGEVEDTRPTSSKTSTKNCRKAVWRSSRGTGLGQWLWDLKIPKEHQAVQPQAAFLAPGVWNFPGTGGLWPLFQVHTIVAFQ